jgi:hypothetical protein
MKIMVIALLTSISAFAATDDAQSWVSSPPADRVSYEHRGSQLEESCIFEVTVSKFDLAYSQYLFAAPIAAITVEQAKMYAGAAYNCSESKHPYLIRGVYFNGGTGGFSAYHWGRNIWIFHGCLAGGENLKKSALVVNLDFNPERVYVSAAVSEK